MENYQKLKIFIRIFLFKCILIIIVSFSIVHRSSSQSVVFKYSLNGNLVHKFIDVDQKVFIIIGESSICKGTSAEYSVSTNEFAKWSNGIFDKRVILKINRDTIINAFVINKYGCEYEQIKTVRAIDLPIKPIINRIGDSLIVTNVMGQFEWYRNSKLFSVG